MTVFGRFRRKSKKGRRLPPHKMINGIRLTPREREIVESLLSGRTNKAIAGEFGVTEQTIKNQLSTLFKKLGVGGRVELVTRVLKNQDRTSSGGL
jgi:DNA-binding NarL/FixJ family response regulator